LKLQVKVKHSPEKLWEVLEFGWGWTLKTRLREVHAAGFVR